jgi:hypothetical protein
MVPEHFKNVNIFLSKQYKHEKIVALSDESAKHRHLKEDNKIGSYRLDLVFVFEQHKLPHRLPKELTE